MYKKALQAKLKRIFDVDKVSFDMPSESQEQDCIFIEIDESDDVIKDGSQTSKVTGKIKMFGELERMPFGYFAKKIREANPDDTKSLFFFKEINLGTFANIAERTVNFIFLFDSQYDPDLGTITSITLSVGSS